MATVGLILRIVFMPVRALAFAMRMLTYVVASTMVIGLLLGLWRSGVLF